MEYRTRAAEVSANRRVGCATTVFALGAGFGIMVFLSTLEPFRPLLARGGVQIALWIGIALLIRQALRATYGYDSRKASARHLKGDDAHPEKLEWDEDVVWTEPSGFLDASAPGVEDEAPRPPGGDAEGRRPVRSRKLA